MFTGCEGVFYKLNIYDANFGNNYHIFESVLTGINLRKLCEKAILIKCILTFDNLNTPLAKHYWNHYKDMRSFKLFHWYKFIFDRWLWQNFWQSPSLSLLMASYVNDLYIFVDKVNWTFFWLAFSFCGIPFHRKLRFNYRWKQLCYFLSRI